VGKGRPVPALLAKQKVRPLGLGQTEKGLFEKIQVARLWMLLRNPADATRGRCRRHFLCGGEASFHAAYFHPTFVCENQFEAMLPELQCRRKKHVSSETNMLRWAL
jgi:hypothetical protein